MFPNIDGQLQEILFRQCLLPAAALLMCSALPCCVRLCPCEAEQTPDAAVLKAEKPPEQLEAALGLQSANLGDSHNIEMEPQPPRQIPGKKKRKKKWKRAGVSATAVAVEVAAEPESDGARATLEREPDGRVRLPDSLFGQLFGAVQADDARAAARLLAAGADPNESLPLAHTRTGEPMRITPLVDAAAGGQVKMVKLLLAHGAAVDARPSTGHYQATAFYCACYHGQPDCVEALVRAGCDVSIKIGPETGRQAAEYQGHTAVLERLEALEARVGAAGSSSGEGVVGTPDEDAGAAGEARAPMRVTADQILAPLREFEARVAANDANELVANDMWWLPHGRPLHVALHRKVAQLNRELQASARLQSAASDCRSAVAATAIRVPAERASEQASIEREGQAEARVQPHVRWARGDWRRIFSAATESGWPPAELVAELTAADRSLNWRCYSNGAPTRLSIGTRVLARVAGSDDLAPGTIVWTCYRPTDDSKNVVPYQILLDRPIDEAGEMSLIYADTEQHVREFDQPGAANFTAQIPSLDEDDCMRLVQTALQGVLFRAWWIIGSLGLTIERPLASSYLNLADEYESYPCAGGFDECDIAGLVDVDVPPGTIGFGLVDVELESAPLHLLSSRVQQKIWARLGAMQSAAEARERSSSRCPEHELPQENDAEQWNNRNGPFKNSVLGGALANYLASLCEMPEGGFPDIRDKQHCSGCGKAASRLLMCSRCHGACYCDATCQRTHHKKHRRSCLSQKQRIENIMSHYSGSLEVSAGMVKTALDITGEREGLARGLIVMVVTGGFFNAVDDDEICAALSLVYRRKVKPAHFRTLEGGNTELSARNAKLRESRQESKKLMLANLQPVSKMCCDIHAKLSQIVSGVQLYCHVGGEKDAHASKSDLIDWVFQRTQHFQIDNIHTTKTNESNVDALPRFLLLVDACVGASVNPNVIDNAAVVANLDLIIADIQRLARAAWIIYGRNTTFRRGEASSDTSDNETDDGDVVDTMRKMEFMRFQGPMLEEGDLHEWMRQPGNWFSIDIVNLARNKQPPAQDPAEPEPEFETEPEPESEPEPEPEPTSSGPTVDALNREALQEVEEQIQTDNASPQDLEMLKRKRHLLKKYGKPGIRGWVAGRTDGTCTDAELAHSFVWPQGGLKKDKEIAHAVLMMFGVCGAEELLDRGCSGHFVLCIAARLAGQERAVSAMLQKPEVLRCLDKPLGARDADIIDYNRMGPLLWAAKSGSLRTVKLLIAAGANVNVRAIDVHHEDPTDMNAGATPLWRACELGRLPIVKFLIEVGADIELFKDRPQEVTEQNSVAG
jgi:hypothetical protein